MRSRSLTILSVVALVAGVQFWGRFDTRLAAEAQVPVADRLMFNGFPGMDAPQYPGDLTPVVPFSGNASSTILIAAIGTICVINDQGVTSSPVYPFGASFRGPINLGVTPVTDSSGNENIFVFAGPASASAEPLKAFLFGPRLTFLDEFGRVDGQEQAGVVMASGNFSADGATEFLFAPGPGVPGAVHVVSPGRDDVITFFPFGESFTGGLNLAAGNLDGLGYDEIVVGGNGRIRVFNLNGDDPLMAGEGFPFGPDFAAGVVPEVFDVNNDGVADLFVAPAQGPPIIRAFNFKVAENAAPQPMPRVMFQYTPFETSRTDGVRLAVGVSNGAAALAATLRDELSIYLLRRRAGGDPTFERTYSGKPFGPTATAIDVKMTPPR